MTRRHFPLDVSFDLPSIVPTSGQAFVEDRRLAPKKHDTVNLQKMGQVAVDEPTAFFRRLPGFGQSVNVDGGGTVRFVNRAHAIVFLGE